MARLKQILEPVGDLQVTGRVEGADVAGVQPAAGRAAADELDAVIGAWTAGVTPGEAEARLRRAGVAAVRVRTADDLLTDPQLLARGFWEQVSHPVAGNFLATGLPFRSAAGGTPRGHEPAPTLGQHNEEILTGILGLSTREIGALAGRQVIGTRPKGL
jgi:crotonobetainyl-CoA:carnitine CoA-transferase CaiB-like acyl-CoA transferase